MQKSFIIVGLILMSFGIIATLVVAGPSIFTGDRLEDINEEVRDKLSEMGIEGYNRTIDNYDEHFKVCLKSNTKSNLPCNDLDNFRIICIDFVLEEVITHLDNGTILNQTRELCIEHANEYYTLQERQDLAYEYEINYLKNLASIIDVRSQRNESSRDSEISVDLRGR